jgi:hypothetical protein
MIGKLVTWWRSSRAWYAEHRQTWPPYTTLVDGRSLLMAEAEGAISSASGAHGLTVAERREEEFDRSRGAREVCVRFKLPPSDVEVWLYSDGAELDTPLTSDVFEEWAFRTPQDFLDELTAAVIKKATTGSTV